MWRQMPSTVSRFLCKPVWRSGRREKLKCVFQSTPPSGHACHTHPGQYSSHTHLLYAHTHTRTHHTYSSHTQTHLLRPCMSHTHAHIIPALTTPTKFITPFKCMCQHLGARSSKSLYHYLFSRCFWSTTMLSDYGSFLATMRSLPLSYRHMSVYG